jgi:hypothetical protein
MFILQKWRHNSILTSSANAFHGFEDYANRDKVEPLANGFSLNRRFYNMQLCNRIYQFYVIYKYFFVLWNEIMKYCYVNNCRSYHLLYYSEEVIMIIFLNVLRFVHLWYLPYSIFSYYIYSINIEKSRKTTIHFVCYFMKYMFVLLIQTMTRHFSYVL